MILDRATVSYTSKLMQHHKVIKTQVGIAKAFDESLKQQILEAFHNDYVEVVSNEMLDLYIPQHLK